MVIRDITATLQHTVMEPTITIIPAHTGLLAAYTGHTAERRVGHPTTRTLELTLGEAQCTDRMEAQARDEHIIPTLERLHAQRRFRPLMAAVLPQALTIRTPVTPQQLGRDQAHTDNGEPRSSAMAVRLSKQAMCLHLQGRSAVPEQHPAVRPSRVPAATTVPEEQLSKQAAATCMPPKTGPSIRTPEAAGRQIAEAVGVQ